MGRSSELRKIAAAAQISRAKLRLADAVDYPHQYERIDQGEHAPGRKAKTGQMPCKEGRILTYSHNNSEEKHVHNSERLAAISLMD